MTRTKWDVLEELETDFRDLQQLFLHERIITTEANAKELKRITKKLIHEHMIPQLKELSELIDYKKEKRK